MNDPVKIKVSSEIGDLEGVILHSMGGEVENMTPENAERALYSDILNLADSKNEYAQLHGVLRKITRVFEVKELLSDILKNEKVKSDLIRKVSINCKGTAAQRGQLLCTGPRKGDRVRKECAYH